MVSEKEILRRSVLEIAKERTELSNLVKGNAEVLPFGDMKFDFLITLHLIEHLFQPELFINEAKRVLKPGGILILATPNPNGISGITAYDWLRI